MPAALDAKEKEKIIDRLFSVFRDHGYEGASLAVFSQATGLGKSSLYHHFPGGKEQMAEAVLGQGKTFVENAIAEVARSPEPLKIRIRKIVAAFDQLYEGGRNYCLLGRLACDGIGPDARQTVREIVTLWINAIAELARASGMSQPRARHLPRIGSLASKELSSCTRQTATPNRISEQCFRSWNWRGKSPRQTGLRKRKLLVSKILKYPGSISEFDKLPGNLASVPAAIKTRMGRPRASAIPIS